MYNIFDNTGTFLISTIFGIAIFLILLRIVLQACRASHYNGVNQIILKITQPLLTPLQRFLPFIQGIDFAAVVLALLLEFIKLWLLIQFKQSTYDIVGLLAWAGGDLLNLLCEIFFYAILARVILSWLAPTAQSPIVNLVYSISEPLLKPARRMIPSFRGMDFSPIVVLLLLQLTNIVIIAPLMNTGMMLVFGPVPTLSMT